MFDKINNLFIGREKELADLTIDLTTSESSDQGHLKFISGDAGIGKSRLLKEIAQQYDAQGYRVLWSKQIENPAVPPFFTWLLVLRSCFANYDENELISDLGSGVYDIAEFIPELWSKLQLKMSVPTKESMTVQYQLFDSVSRFLLMSSKRRPIIILLDNLHLADRSSLELLEYFSQQISGYPIVIICAYRTIEPTSNTSLKSTLNRLSLNHKSEQFSLEGLQKQHVAQLLEFHTQISLPTSLIDTIYQQSDGNPLYINEIAKVIKRRKVNQILPSTNIRFNLPDGIRAVILARLDALPETNRLLLGKASVLGRTVDILIWSKIVKENSYDLIKVIQNAENLGIINILSPRKIRFHHALFREVLYAEIGLTDRTKLHIAAATSFEEFWNDGDETIINALAYHLFEIATYGYANKAVRFNSLAANKAREKRAYNESAKFLQQALTVLELESAINFKSSFQILISLGISLFNSGQQYFASEPIVQAAELALKEKQWLSLAESLAELQFISGQQGNLHKSYLLLHRSLLDNLPSDAFALRTRAMASLSDAYRLQGKFELANKTAIESMELANNLNDPILRLDCFCRGGWAISSIALNPQDAEYRRKLSKEILEIAKTYGALEDKLLIMSIMSFDLTSRSSSRALQQHLIDFRLLIGSVNHPHYLNVLAGFEISINILQGKWQEAMRNALALQNRANIQDAIGIEGGFGQQMFVMQRTRGQLGGAAALIKKIESDIDPEKLWLPGQILLHCDLGNFQRARELLINLGTLSKLTKDDLYLASLIYLSEACIAINDRLRLIELYKLLKPYRGFIALIPGTVSMGAVSGYMAVVAVHLGKLVRAKELFREAIELNSKMGADPWLARVQSDYARLLLQSNLNKDISFAQELIASASNIAVKLELTPILSILKDLQIGSHIEILTKRERAVLNLVARGTSNKVIAVEMSISLSTVATHVRNILRKLRVSNRTEATDFARRVAWLD